jgi:type IV secretion system protein VirB9
MKNILQISMLAVSLISTAYGLSVPKGSHLDSRVQTLTYNPHDVFRVNARLGTSTLIKLEDDERLEGDAGLGIGDAKAWSIAIKGNNIFLKPTAHNADTNMVLVTNKRTYAFLLSTQKHQKKHAESFVIRFAYPDTELARRKDQDQKLHKARQIATPDQTQKNMNYYMFGDTSIAPTAAWDDGRFTYFEYNTNREIPVVFKVTDDGEAIINSHVEGTHLVVHETAKKFMLRLGKRVLGVDNDGYTSGQFNRRGSSVNNAVRLIK